MLYHNTKNNDEKRKIKKMIDEQEKDNYNNTLYKKYNRQPKKISMEKRSEGDSDIKGKKENE